jgi:DNA-binding NarL/FixJ family response regulator
MGGTQPTIRVLLADDSSLIRMSLLRALQSAGDIEVVAEATTGLEAVEKACRLHPDLVLMDVNLPGIDGIEATRRIKAECPEVRVVGLTMYTHVTTPMQQAGATACLDKALNPGALVAAVRGYASSRE